MKNNLTPIAIVAVIIIVGIIGAASILLTQGGPKQTTTTSPTTTSSTTSTTQSVSLPELRSLFDQHMSRISSRDVSLILGDYEDNAVVLWTGETAGLGGIYSRTANITILYSSALSTAQRINITSTGYSQVNGTSTKATVQATLNLVGNSKILGAFNGTVDAEVSYKYDNGAWKITNENWNYKVLNVTVAGGGTTFPEWQRVGPINASRRSPDWLHNFSWDYGGPGVAVMIWAYAVLIGAAVLMKRVRRGGK